MSLTISNNNNGRVSDVMISERKNVTVKPQLQKSAAKRNIDCLLLSCKLPSQEEEKNILQLLRSQQQQEEVLGGVDGRDHVGADEGSQTLCPDRGPYQGG